MTPTITRLTNSLAFRIIAFGVIFLLLGSLMRFFVSSEVLRNGIEENAATQQLSMANYVARDIDSKITMRLHFLEKLAGDLPLELWDKPRELETWLAQQQMAQPLFSLGLVVIPLDGKGAIADYPALVGRRQLDFNDRDWFIAARETGRIAIGKPTIGRAAFQPVLNMATPVRGVQGKFFGVLMGVTALSAPGFLDIIQTHHIGATGSLLLFSPRDQIFVTATEPALRLKSTPPPGVNRLHDQAMTGWRGAGITVNAFGIENLAAFASVPSVDWVVVARIPTTEIFATIESLQKNNLRLSLVAAIILTTLLAFLMRWLLKPLKEAEQQMRAMANDQIALAPLPVVRSDEVGAMVESFNLLVAKLQKAESAMNFAAHHDALTGLSNRRSLLSHMRQSLALAGRQSRRMAVLFIDLDGFKPVNDLHGHKVGDAVLQQVAQRLTECVRQSDLVGRLGGDEFLVLLTECHGHDDAAVAAEKIIARLAQPYDVQPGQVIVGASMGIALFPDHAPDVDGLIACADTAMYSAKHEGRGVFRF